MKSELQQEEVFGDLWKNKIDDWLHFVKNIVLCSTSSYVGFSKAMEHTTGFRKNDCWSLPGLVWKHLNSLRNDKTSLSTHIMSFMRSFVIRSAKSGRVCFCKQ